MIARVGEIVELLPTVSYEKGFIYGRVVQANADGSVLIEGKPHEKPVKIGADFWRNPLPVR